MAAAREMVGSVGLVVLHNQTRVVDRNRRLLLGGRGGNVDVLKHVG